MPSGLGANWSVFLFVLVEIYKNQFTPVYHVISPARHPVPGCLRRHFLQRPLFLDTQKNSVHRESISMELTRLLLDCPLVAFTRLFLHLRDNDAGLDTPICVYFERKGGAVKSVTRTPLVALLRLWSGNIGLD